MDSSTRFMGKGTSAGSVGHSSDPIPHPALREGVVAKLLSFVSRAMAIARLTHLRISVPSSGASPGEVPNDCFPETDIPAVITTSRRVTFAPTIQTTLKHELRQEKPAPAEDFLFKNILRAPAMGAARKLTETDGNHDRDSTPRWRLA